MATNNLPKLQFFSGSSSGFTPSGISGFSDLRPAAIVRELVQNSLDAAIEAEMETARIRFRLSCCGKEEIPGIQEYEDAFNQAVDTQKGKKGEFSSQASRVVKVMEDALKRSKQNVLSILDNGIGLNESRMNALLSDGISVKGGNAMGTYGNGHSTIIPASDLRYILYGGINPEGNKIGSGHAVLASSNKNGEPQPTSGDGFFVLRMENGRHVCATGQQLPFLITKDLDWIMQNLKHGTAVIVPAFNYFRQTEEDLWGLVSESVARNFFPAIQEGHLIVEFQDIRSEHNAGDIQVLDRGKLREILSEGKENTRRTARAFINGARAHSAYITFQEGKKHTIKTEIGAIEIRHRLTDSGKTRVDLYRNGMWITDTKNIPRFRHAFSGCQPFHVVLLLNSKLGNRLHELVRNAEGPLHNELHPKQRLSKDEARKLESAFGEIKKYIEAKTPKIKPDSYSPDDFLALDFGKEGEIGPNYPSYWGTPEALDKRVPTESYVESDTDSGPSHPKDIKSVTKSTKSRPKPQLAPVFTAASVSVGTNCQRIVVNCQKNLSNAQLRLCVDQNLDATCDPHSRNDTEALALGKIQVDGKPVDKRKLIKENGHVRGVYLGDIKSEDSLDIIVEYSLPSDLMLPSGHEPTLRVDIFKGMALSDIG